MSNPNPAELQNIFDFLELKRGEGLNCWLCGGNQWSARITRRVEEDHPRTQELSVRYVQLVCQNCKFVAEFTDKILEGP